MWKNSSLNLLLNFVQCHKRILNTTLFNVVKRFDIQSFAQFCLTLWKELPCNILLNFVQWHYWICHIIIYSTLLNVVKRSTIRYFSQFNSVINLGISFAPIKINLIKLLPKCRIRKHMETWGSRIIPCFSPWMPHFIEMLKFSTTLLLMSHEKSTNKLWFSDLFQEKMAKFFSPIHLKKKMIFCYYPFQEKVTKICDSLVHLKKKCEKTYCFPICLQIQIRINKDDAILVKLEWQRSTTRAKIM
jgi:hypothetical protein